MVIFRGKCCPFFWDGCWRENRLRFLWKLFLVHFGKLGGQSSGMGAAEILLRFPVGFLRENPAFSTWFFKNPTFFPFAMFVIWLCSDSC